ncbi:hypothetical protein Tco_0794023 [Tanacetum coccineum]
MGCRLKPTSVYEVGGPSTAAAKGPSFPLPAPGLPIPPVVIEDLSTRLGNLEYGHEQLVQKVIQVSDAEMFMLRDRWGAGRCLRLYSGQRMRPQKTRTDYGVRLSRCSLAWQSAAKRPQIQMLQTIVTVQWAAWERNTNAVLLGIEKRIAHWVGWKLRWLVIGLKIRNGENFSYIGRMLPLMYQQEGREEDFFPRNGSEKIRNSKQGVTSISIIGGKIEVANALVRTVPLIGSKRIDRFYFAVIWLRTGKGIELLSEVALTEDDQYEEVRKKSLKDFHKQDTSNDEENDSDDENTQFDNENELDSEHEPDEYKSGSEYDHQEYEEEGMKSESSQGLAEDAHVTISTVPQKTETLFSTYGKVYSLKRSQKDKDKDEDPLAGSDRGLKKRKTSKDAEPTKGPKTKESQYGSSKGTKSQPKSSRKSIQSEEPEFEVADSDMPQDQEGNLGNDDDEPMKETVSKRDWFTKPTQPQEPTDPDWNDGKTPQLGPTQSWLMTLASSADKPSKNFDELMSTPIDFSTYIMNGLKISNLTQETLLGPAFRLLKGTRTNYNELEYDFEECYKALSEKLDWENPEGGDYPFDLTKPLHLVMSGNHQKVPVDYFFNNDLKYLQGGVSTMTYTTSITKTKADQYDLPGIEDMNRLTNLSGDDVSDFAIALRMFTRSLVIQKRVEDLQLGVESYQKKINVTKTKTTKSGIRKRNPYTPYQDPQGFIYVDNKGRNRLMRSDELYKFSDRTLTGLRTSLDDITKNI